MDLRRLVSLPANADGGSWIKIHAGRLTLGRRDSFGWALVAAGLEVLRQSLD